jgi:hypothetical protein
MRHSNSTSSRFAFRYSDLFLFSKAQAPAAPKAAQAQASHPKAQPIPGIPDPTYQPPQRVPKCHACAQELGSSCVVAANRKYHPQVRMRVHACSLRSVRSASVYSSMPTHFSAFSVQAADVNYKADSAMFLTRCGAPSALHDATEQTSENNLTFSFKLALKEKHFD